MVIQNGLEFHRNMISAQKLFFKVSFKIATHFLTQSPVALIRLTFNFCLMLDFQFKN